MQQLKEFNSSVTFNEYQEESIKTATMKYGGLPPLVYYGLKLSGEAGEVAEKIGKLYRDWDGVMSQDRELAIVKELGDVLWYISAIAWELGVTLVEVAIINRLKLIKRIQLGTIHGDGDDR